MFIAGLISKLVHCWDDIVDPSSILLTWVKDGVQLPFLFDYIPPFELNNPLMCREHEIFINAEIQRLVESGAVERCINKPKYISPIKCVSKKGKGKYRLIIDLRRLNGYLIVPTFKYEDINLVLQQILPDDELVSVDLQNGFQHILVHPDDRDFLGFRWGENYFRFKVLPFGLACSPYYFCKILRPVANYLRNQGLRVCFYMDDILLMSQSKDITYHRDLLLTTLQRLGWQINPEKSELIPTQEIVYIGYKILTNVGHFPVLRIPSERICKVRKDIRRILTNGKASARCLARIAGQCVSMAKAVLPAKLLLRNLYRLISQKTAWEEILWLDMATIKDLNWWNTALQNWNGRHISTRPVEIQIETDASQTGWGARLMSNGNQAAGYWDKVMSTAPSNARELMAVIMAILSFKETLIGKAVQVLTDNISTTAYIMHMGGPSVGLTNMVANLWTICYQYNIDLSARYLAGKDNVVADRLSRLEPQHEWQLHPYIFGILDGMWGRHTIDRFASMKNKLIDNYNAQYWDPLCSGVDALAQRDWQIHNNFVNCPFNLLQKVLDKIIMTRSMATIIAPWWPGRPWFSKLKRLSVAPPWRIPKHVGVTWTGGVRPEPLRNLRWSLYAWRVHGGLI
jgi:hypothetical protein